MKIEYPTRKHWVIYALLFALLILLTPRAGLPADVVFWERWGVYIFKHGLGNIYQIKDNNYPPLFHYVLLLFGKLSGSVEKLLHYRHFIKLFILPFDFASALLAAWIFAPGDRNQRFIASLLLLGNLAFVYNTVVWEQVDGMFSCLVFGAVVLALRQRAAISMVCYLLALNTKTQAIIFLPPLLLLWMPLWRRAPRTLLVGVCSAALVQLLVLAPFIWGGTQNSLGRIAHVVVHGVDFYPFVSMNAFNWWMAGFKGSTPDTLRYAGLTYKQWGLLSFALVSTIAMLPLARATWNKLYQRDAFSSKDYASLMLSFGLIPIIFTLCNTQMHERYWHPALLFLASYGFLTGRYFLYGMFSVAYLLNLEVVMQYLGLKKYGVAVFSSMFGASLFTLILAVGLFQLYRLTQQMHSWALRRPAKTDSFVATTQVTTLS